MAFGQNPTTGTQGALPTNQFPLGSVAVPGAANGDLTALEGGPVSTDSNGNKTAPASLYVKDGGDVTQGASTDANTANSVIGRLTRVRDILLGLLGQQTKAASLSVTVASDQPALPVSGAFYQATQPVSTATLPLPTGASTAAKQPALGTAGTASSDVLSIQGVAAMMPLKVDASATTQPVSGAVSLADSVISGNKATVAQFHNADHQSPGGTAYGLLTGGVAQLLTTDGYLDRQRETGQDGIAAQGIATSTQQLASPFTSTVGASPIVASGTAQTITPAAMSGTSRGAAWAIQSGSVLSIDTGANRETVLITAVTPTTFTAICSKSHAASAVLLGYVYNQARDATTSDGSTGQGFSAGATYLFNAQLNNGTGGWESERSASGEQDNASGAGTAVAAGYEYNGLTYDRERNVQGKGMGSGTVASGGTTGSTSVTPTAAPTGLQPGSPVYLSGGTGAIEVAYTTTAYVAGSSPLLLQSAISGNNRTTLQWDLYLALGPGLSGILPSGIGLEEDVVFDPVSNLFYLERSATQDAVSGQNLPMEALGLYNGTTFDRLRTAGNLGDQFTLGFIGAAMMIFNGGSFDRVRTPTRFVPIPAVAVVAGTPVAVWTPAGGKKFHLMGYNVSLSVAGAIIFKDGTTTEVFRTSAMAAGVGILNPANLGNGYASTVSNQGMFLDATASGTITGFAFGTEEY